MSGRQRIAPAQAVETAEVRIRIRRAKLRPVFDGYGSQMRVGRQIACAAKGFRQIPQQPDMAPAGVNERYGRLTQPA